MPTRATPLLVAVLLASLFPAAARAQDAAAFAQQRFAAGLARYESGDAAGALSEFRASYSLFASPNSRLYIARSLRDLGRLAEAVTELELAVAEATDRARTEARYADTGAAAQAELAALEPRVARLAIRLAAARPPPGVRVRVDAREVPAAALGLPLALAPGRAVVRVDAPGCVPVVRAVDLAPGQRAALVVPLAPRAPPPHNDAARALYAAQARRGALRTAAAVGTAVTGAALVAFAVSAGIAASDHATLRARCGEMTACPASEQPLLDEGRAAQAAANVALGVALGAGAVAVALWTAALWPPAPPRRVDVRVGLGSIRVTGVF